MISPGLDSRKARCDRCLSMHHPRTMIHTKGQRFCSKSCVAKVVAFGTAIPTPRRAA